VKRELMKSDARFWLVRLKVCDRPQVGEAPYIEANIRAMLRTINLDAGISIEIESVVMNRDAHMVVDR
jgi:hypothetical protein